MSCGCLSDRKKMFISIQTALIAFIIFNPMMYQLVRNVLSGVASADGLPTTFGLLLHTALFGLIIFILMKPTSSPKMVRQTVESLPLQ